MTLCLCRDECQCLRGSNMSTCFVQPKLFTAFVMQRLFQIISLYTVVGLNNSTPAAARCLCSSSCRSPFRILFMIKSQPSQRQPASHIQPSSLQQTYLWFLHFYNYPPKSVFRQWSFNSTFNEGCQTHFRLSVGKPLCGPNYHLLNLSLLTVTLILTIQTTI